MGVKHLENLKYLYGENVSVQIPNFIFRDLSSNVKGKNINTNIQQVSFAYAYLVVIAFLYKYAHYVDIDNGTYIQNADIKELLGYSKQTRTVDYIIKKNGLLDEIGLSETSKDYPIQFTFNDDKINNIPIRDFVTISDLNTNDTNYSLIKGIVKNRNYEIKEPTFLFEYKEENGTLYDYSNTHKVTIGELLLFIGNENLNNIDFSMYCYFKSKCKGYKDNMKSIALNTIVSELGVGKDAFYAHLQTLKDNKFIDVCHKKWTMGAVADSLESNEYYFKGV